MTYSLARHCRRLHSAGETDVLGHDMGDVKPIEVEKSSVAVETSEEGNSAVPKAAGEKTYCLPPVSMLQTGAAKISSA